MSSPNSSQTSSAIFEGGDENQLSVLQEEDSRNFTQYGEEEPQYEDDIDPDDPYQINNLNEIEHDVLKEMYT